MLLGTRTNSGSDAPGAVDVVDVVDDVGIEEVVVTEPPEKQQIQQTHGTDATAITATAKFNLNSAYQVASLISQTPWKEKATPFSQYLS